MRLITLITSTIISLNSIAQTPTILNKVEFGGNKLLILRVMEEQENEVSGKLSTGETVKAGCYDGALLHESQPPRPMLPNRRTRAYFGMN